METRQRDELELVPHAAKRDLKVSNRRRVQCLGPLEGSRAVIGEQLARKRCVNDFSEFPSLFEIGCEGLIPEQIGIWGIGEATGDGRVETAVVAAIAFRSSFLRDEPSIAS